MIREEKTVCLKIGQGDKDCVIQRVGGKGKKMVIYLIGDIRGIGSLYVGLMTVVAAIVREKDGANRSDESWCGDVLSRMGITTQTRNDGVDSVKARCRDGGYGIDGQINKKMDMVQTGNMSCGGVMWDHGWVYRHRQGTTEWILSQQCDVMDWMERRVR